ncbi:MAG: cupin domain-containing protein [Gammaproteobacteria bacterium]|nr:cupin domain-containing protein [Gammaproteobacteria bacterium]
MVAFADAPLQSIEFNGSVIHRLWESGALPVRLPVDRDAGASAGNAYRPGFTGTSLYLADLPAGTVGVIPMHRQDSLDYIAVLAGEVHLLLEDQELLLRTGDVLVQAGNLHSWENRAESPCRLLVVVLSGERGAQEA